MRTDHEIVVRFLDPAVSDDADFLARLSDLINDVYATAEKGLWRDGFTRTTASELGELIRAREIAVATHGGQTLGSVRIHDVGDDKSEFGILVAAPEHRDAGIGRALLDFAEDRSRERGLRAIQLELLLPRTWSHPNKEFLKAWYGRRGYRLTATRSIDDAHPQLAPLLATPCDVGVYEKAL